MVMSLYPYFGEFEKILNDLKVGNVLTVEKDEGLWYFPALLEMSFSLDGNGEFSLSFANALRLDDWGDTYADLISNASNTSRKVGANWQNLMAYAKEKETWIPLIKDPLDAALRASFANSVNQNFIVDNTGILGRQETSDGSGEYSGEQLRILNNLILFTNDGWDTASLALGKIKLGNQDVYGLVADAIVGTLVMGERVVVKNKNNTISLNSSGITVKNPSGTTTFQADNAGNVTLSGKITASSGFIGGWQIQNAAIINKYIDGVIPAASVGVSPGINTSDLSLTTSYTGWKPGETKGLCFWAGAVYNGNHTGEWEHMKLSQAPFRVYKDGTLYASKAVITGNITANGGSFTGTVNATDGVFRGTVYATNGEFTGKITASSGSFSTSLTVGGRPLSSWISSGGYVKLGSGDSIGTSTHIGETISGNSWIVTNVQEKWIYSATVLNLPALAGESSNWIKGGRPGVIITPFYVKCTTYDQNNNKVDYTVTWSQICKAAKKETY